MSANAGKYPLNLDGVYLLTFTDGLDAGSTGFLSPVENQDFSDKYESDYQAYLQGQITNRPVAGRAITAYSAGVRGSDVQDTALFRSSLSGLASSPGNFFELSNFSQLNERFDAIAKNLTVTTENTTFELRTPSFSRGTKIRMTFDSVNGADASKRYVEGTVASTPNRTFKLTNIVYSGTSSDTGLEIEGVMNGTEAIYTFTNFKGFNPAADNQVKQWTQRNGSTVWQVNSEYEAGNSTTTTKETRSAVVYIALDSSRSLSDNDVAAVRTAMKQFVRTLYERSQNQTPGTLVVTTVTAGTLTVSGTGVNQSATLSSGGNWNKADLAPGTYTLTVRYSDGKSESKTVSVTNGQVAIAGFAYQPAPQVPRNVRAGTPGTDRVTLTWDSAGTGVSYQVYYNTQNNPSGAKAFGNPAAGLSMNVTGIASGTNYYFWVSTVKDGQESGKSPVVTVLTAAVPVERPVSDGFVRINGGTFTMGSPASETGRSSNEVQHQVTVSSFYMGKYEVTQREYQAVMGTNPSGFKGDNLPVENVSWYDAVEYCNARSRKEGLTPAYTISGSGDNRTVTWNRNTNGYRLPTEAEWEYACRAGTTTPYSSGSSVDGVGWYGSNSGSTTHPVGAKQANVWGLYDMHGNVWEWCWDWYGSYGSGSQTDPLGASSGTYRVERGGCWIDNGQYLRSALRFSGTPSYRVIDLGFRLARPSL